MKKTEVILSKYDDNKEYYEVDSSEAVEILSSTGVVELGGIDRVIFEEALRNLSRDSKVKLVVRRNRSISANTGTLLSPDDRNISSRFVNDAVLILYRLTGEKSKGWLGSEFWVPNVKMPGNRVIYFK